MTELALSPLSERASFITGRTRVAAGGRVTLRRERRLRRRGFVRSGGRAGFAPAG